MKLCTMLTKATVATTVAIKVAKTVAATVDVEDPDSDDHHDNSVSSAISRRPRRVNDRHVANDSRPHIVSLIGATQLMCC